MVADSSALIGIAAAGAFEVLRRRFGRLAITRIVKDEVMAGQGLPGTRELEAAMRAGWIRVAPAPPETWDYAGIDYGEASTIALALRSGGALVLIDDVLGRARAEALGLRVMTAAELLAGEPRRRASGRSSSTTTRRRRAPRGNG